MEEYIHNLDALFVGVTHLIYDGNVLEIYVYLDHERKYLIAHYVVAGGMNNNYGIEIEKMIVHSQDDNDE